MEKDTGQDTISAGKREINPKQRDFFNSRASGWDSTISHDLKKVRAIVESMGLQRGTRVLDVGTGTGITIPFLEESVGADGGIVCVDYAENMIAIARRKHPKSEFPNVTFVVSDVNELMMDSDFDAILCYSCFPHFIDQESTLQHLANGLRKGGRLMVAHSQSRSDINKVHMESGEVVEKDYLPTMEELRAMMERAGLTVRKTIDDKTMFYILGVRR